MIEYDEYGNPLPPGMKRPISANPALAEAGITTEGSINDVAQQQNNDYLSGERNYAANTGQGEPQQFGTPEPARNDEVALTPQETAERMPSDPDAMTKLIKQHMLPMAPQASRDGYQNYVTAEREKRNAERDQQRQQGYLNRQAAADKDAQAWDQTLNLNALQGAGPRANGGGQGFSAYNFASQNGMLPQVNRIGGYAFVRGQNRPMTPEEMANVDLKRANAEYMRSRPDIEAGKATTRENIETTRAGARIYGADQGLAGRQYAADKRLEGVQSTNESREGIAADNREQKGQQFDANQDRLNKQQEQLTTYRNAKLKIAQEAAQRAQQAIDNRDTVAADKEAQASLGRLQQYVAELKARQGLAKSGDGMANKLFGIVGMGKSQKQFQDRMIDAKGNPGSELPGSYGALVDAAKLETKNLEALSPFVTEGAFKLDPEFQKFVQDLHK